MTVSQSAKETVKNHYLVVCGIFGVLTLGIWVGIGFGIHFSRKDSIQSTKETVKNHYLIVCGIFGVLTLGLWVGIGFGIHFAGGEDPYYAGPIVTVIGVMVCLLCSVRVYMNVMDVGQKPERDKEIASMIDILTLALAVTLIASIPGVITNVTMGLDYCSYSSTRYRDTDCQYEEENQNVSRGLLAACAITMIVCFAGLTFNQYKKRALGLVIQVRVGHVNTTILMTHINQNQTGGTNPYYQGQMQGQGFQNQGFQNGSVFNPYPPPQPNPYPNPGAPSGQMPPPPSYYETGGGSTVYPPPQASYPSGYGVH